VEEQAWQTNSSPGVKPEEIAHLAVYLGSGESDGMTGQSILLDGDMLVV
jgi:enoyl-[acyl-carrier-protein] reductase (NADH)